MKPVNIVLGRFQPFTLGHLACVKQAYSETGMDTVLCIIETPENKVDERHPFATKDIIPMIDPLFGEDNLLDYVLVKNADIVKIADALHDKGYELASWTCGTDRYAAYSRQCKGYWEKAGLPEEPKCIEVKRGDDDVSATKVRQAIKDGDFNTCKKLVPQPWAGQLTFKKFQSLMSKVTEDTGNQNRYGKMKPLFEYIMEAFNPLKSGVYKISKGTIEVDTKKSEVIFSQIVSSKPLEYHIPLEDVNKVIQGYLNKSHTSIISIQHDDCGIVYQPLPNTVSVWDDKTSKFNFEFSAHELQNIIKK